MPLRLPEEELAAHRLLGELFPLPTSYLVLDVETTGLSPSKDFVIDIGVLEVAAGEVITSANFEINWPDYLSDAADPLTVSDFALSLEKTAASMRDRGHTYPYTFAGLRERGWPPLEVFRRIREMISAAADAGHPVVGHNLLGFDAGMLTGSALRIFGQQADPLAFDRCDFVDTGLIEKAVQLPTTRVLWPDTECGSKLEFYLGISKLRVRGVKWSLEPHCSEKYRLHERFRFHAGLGHEARYHCFMTHALLQTFRQLAYGEAASLPTIAPLRAAETSPQGTLRARAGRIIDLPPNS